MTIKIELSKKQKIIVYAENGPIYVKASAGSGKTRVLTERVRYLLGRTNKKVLALTFTNKAGEEIKERLSDIAEIEKNGTLTLNFESAEGSMQSAVLSLEEVEISSADIPGWLVTNDGSLTVAMDITITEELKQEGIAREFINRIQNLRKDSG